MFAISNKTSLTRIMTRSAILIAALLANSASAIAISSTFDNDREGWRLSNLRPTGDTFNVFSQPNPQFKATNGDPDGYIFGPDNANGQQFFRAPNQYTGDLTGFIGGQLTFSYFSTGSAVTWTPDTVMVYVQSGSNFYGVQNLLPPTAGLEAWHTQTVIWEHTSFVRYTQGGNFVAVTANEFATALSNVGRFFLGGEIQTGSGDIIGIDTIELNSERPQPPVEPLPLSDSLIALLAGLGVLAVRRKVIKPA